MAIQIPNPGTGNGATGDNEFVLWTKTKDNFTNTTHAANRLVGTAAGNVLEVGAFGLGGTRESLTATALASSKDGFVKLAGDHGGVIPANAYPYSGFSIKDGTGGTVLVVPASTGSAANAKTMGYRFVTYTHANVILESVAIYTTGNTTKDSNGFIKAASPIVKVFADKVELNDDAERQNVTYKRNGIGDYTITTVSGLSTDGWYIELPKDMNGNPKVAVTLSEVDGVISLKSYKRIFSMETFTFEPDLDNPLDIPDTRWIDLRLNEIHVEMPDDIQTEV